MRTSQYLLATLKENPADAEVISHQLMLRAGMIRKTAAGIYSWLPLGWRVLNKISTIVREEMDRAGALEILMPAVQPQELWEESGRLEQYGPELLRFTDRHERGFCFGPTHEEVITAIVRNELRSYKQLPLNLYQVQTKFRDEIRPRFGVMRGREFVMKDAYSFDISPEKMAESYQKMYDAYNRIFERMGLAFRPVHADTGNIGGSASHEFQVLADTGEDLIAYSDGSDYAANIELAEAIAPEGQRPAPGSTMETVDTPGQYTIAAIQAFLKVDIKHTVKTLLVKGSEAPMVALILRGDHDLNELKAEKHPLVAAPLTFVSDEDIEKTIGAKPGSIGPVGLDLPIIVDRSAAHVADFICGANENDKHYINVNWGRDLAEPEDIFDLRNVVAGDASPDGKGTLQFARGIEVGHVFQLGQKYSKSMNATVLDESGKAQQLYMGCYGLGVGRTVAACIEQNHDARGIIWPEAIAPFQVVIVPINMHKSVRLRETVDAMYQRLTDAGYEVLLDDRQERPGVMFADMDLIGIPHRIVMSDRGLDAGTVEYKLRREKDHEEISIDDVLARIAK